MERRKFLIGAGSTALGASALVGSGAFNVARADRSVNVDIVDDSEAYLALRPTSAYSNKNSNGMLEVDFSNNGRGGKGLSKNANYVFNDVFAIENQGTDNIIIDLSDSLDSNEWNTTYPRAYWTGDKLETTQNVGGDGEFNDNRPIIPPGADVFVQFEFVGRNAETTDGRDSWPDNIGIYAEATDQSTNL